MFMIDTKHLSARRVSYLSHAMFAVKIGLRMAISSIMFLVHAAAPFVQIQQAFNLESMSIYLFDKNVEAED